MTNIYSHCMGGNGAFREIHSGSGNTPAKQQPVGRQHARREQLSARSDQAAGEAEKELRLPDLVLLAAPSCSRLPIAEQAHPAQHVAEVTPATLDVSARWFLRPAGFLVPRHLADFFAGGRLLRNYRINYVGCGVEAEDS